MIPPGSVAERDDPAAIDRLLRNALVIGRGRASILAAITTTGAAIAIVQIATSWTSHQTGQSVLPVMVLFTMFGIAPLWPGHRHIVSDDTGTTLRIDALPIAVWLLAGGSVSVAIAAMLQLFANPFDRPLTVAVFAHIAGLALLIPYAVRQRQAEIVLRPDAIEVPEGRNTITLAWDDLQVRPAQLGSARGRISLAVHLGNSTRSVAVPTRFCPLKTWELVTVLSHLRDHPADRAALAGDGEALLTRLRDYAIDPAAASTVRWFRPPPVTTDRAS